MITVVRYTASWCQPCKVYAPIFDQVSKKFKEVSFEVVSYDENPEKFNEAGVSGVPTTIIFAKDKQVANFTGLMQESELIRFIESANQDVALL